MIDIESEMGDVCENLHRYRNEILVYSIHEIQNSKQELETWFQYITWYDIKINAIISIQIKRLKKVITYC